MPVPLTPLSGTSGKPPTYWFSHSKSLNPGYNQITALAEDYSGHTGSDKISLQYGEPATVKLVEFHMTQRGIMEQQSCDWDGPFVAGKFTIVRIRIDAYTAPVPPHYPDGLPTIVNQVQMKLYRKDGGQDVLVDDPMMGETYSSQLTWFNSPGHLAGIHFWIPGHKVDTPGEYKMRFEAWIGGTKWPHVLDVPCADKYFQFSRTKPINILIQPVEAPLFSWDLPKRDHELVLKALDMVNRMYPVRDGVRPRSHTAKAGVRYTSQPPYKVCDGKKTSEFCKGKGFEWTFKDTRASGISKAAHDEVLGTNLDCDSNIPRWGQIFSFTILENLPRPTIFGLFRGGEPAQWTSGGNARKWVRVFDDDRDGTVQDDLANYVAEVRNIKQDGTLEWTTNLSLFDPLEAFRTWVDSDVADLCHDKKNETAAPIDRRWRNVVGNLLFGPQKKALEWWNANITWDVMDHGVLWFSEAFHPDRKDFGMFDPGQGQKPGKLVWVRATPLNALAHELGHNFGLSHHEAPAARQIKAWQAYVRDKRVDASSLISNMWGNLSWRDTPFFTYSYYLHTFKKLKVSSSSSAAAAESESGSTFVASGVIGPLGDLTFVDTTVTTADDLTEPDPESPYRLLLGAGEEVFLDMPFRVHYALPPDSTDEYTPDHLLYEDLVGTFRVVVPFPENTQWAEIIGPEEVLLHLRRSANAPTVQVLQPNGGEQFGANDQVVIEWNAEDLDGDELEYNVAYSPDSTRWYLMAGGLTTTRLDWNTAETPGGQEALIRVQASDGFHVGDDQSDQVFSVEGKPPVAVIYQPEALSEFLQWEHITLRGDAFDGETENLGITWHLNGKVVATGTSVRLNPLPPGEYIAHMEVVDGDGLYAHAETEFRVLADSDGDGMANFFEEQYALERGFAGDAFWDLDEDGLNSFEESWRKLDPTNPDTDGDGLLDGQDPHPLDPEISYVNFAEFAFLANQWLNDECGEFNDFCQWQDRDQSGVVDFADLGLLIEEWLSMR